MGRKKKGREDFGFTF